MKLALTFTSITLAAILVGCGGGGGSSTAPEEGTTSSTPTAGNTSSSTTQSTSSQPANQGAESINSANLANMSVVAEYREGTKVQNIEKVTYIFLPNNEAIVVFDLSDGSRKVARDSHYYESDGNNVALTNIEFDNGDSFGIILAAGISSPGGIDLITVGESTAFPYKVTAILSNEDNGIDETSVTNIDNTSSSSSVDANSPLATAANITIYNNSSATEINNAAPTFENNGFTRYDSNVPLHCTDYGFTTALTESTNNGVHSISYLNDDRMCTEIDNENGSYPGNTNTAFYK
jgi:hypothetical protein